jgi:hypothetical protein
MAANAAKIQALGLEVEDQANFVQIKEAATGHRIYVAKESRTVKHLPTTMECGGELGETVPEGTNGKIAAYVAVDLFEQALEALASARYGKVRPSKRTKKAAVVVEAVPEMIEDEASAGVQA